MATTDLLSAALQLPERERAKLAHELLRSLDQQEDADVDEAWLAEVERRAEELADGSVTPVDWTIARRRIVQRLRERRGAG